MYYCQDHREKKSTHYFETYCYVNFKTFSANTIFRWYTCRKIYIVKFNYFSGRPSKVKDRFWKCFDWPLCGWYWKKKYCWCVIKNICICVTQPILCRSVLYIYRMLYLQFLGSYDICIFYLHVIETCLKVAITMLCFCYSKSLFFK